MWVSFFIQVTQTWIGKTDEWVIKALVFIPGLFDKSVK